MTSPSQSNNSSQVALLSEPSMSQKDYNSAFLSLQNSYGLNGESPMPSFDSSSKKSKKSKKVSQPKPQPQPSSQSQGRNWEDALVSLQLQYGLNGGSPMQPVMPSRPKKSSSSSSKQQPKSEKQSTSKLESQYGSGWNPICSYRSSL